MIKGIKYDCYYYSFSAQEISNRGPLGRNEYDELKPVKTYYFGEKDLQREITSFKARHEADGVPQKYYHEFCREWEKGGKKYLEYITGFVSDDQSSTDFKALIGHK